MLVRTQKGYVLALSGSILLLTTALATFVLVLRTAFLMVSTKNPWILDDRFDVPDHPPDYVVLDGGG